MRVADRWASGQKETVSFELFPAKSEKAEASLQRAIAKLSGLAPDFVSVTFGAGGSTREGSRQLLGDLKEENGLDVIAYFAGFGLGPDQIKAVLDDYAAMGIENLLVVRGDPPREEEFVPHPDAFAHATDLLEFIRPRYSFCLGVAGYPEAHVDAASQEQDLDYLKLKVELGAQYIITNYFYDNRFFFSFIDRCRAAGIRVPIVPGVMPVYSVRMMGILAGLCGATITDELKNGLAQLPEDDKEALAQFGIEFATAQCVELLEAGVPGLHIYTMDRSQAAVGIVNALREHGLL